MKRTRKNPARAGEARTKDANRAQKLKDRAKHYVELARAAARAGDDVAAENHYQHAEHFVRLMNASRS